jgi:hypothetical protein
MLGRIMDIFMEALRPPRVPGAGLARAVMQERRLPPLYSPPLYVISFFTFRDALDMFEQDWMSQHGVYFSSAPRQAAPSEQRAPVFKTVEVSDAEATCSICLGNYDGTQKAVRTRCRHIFHAACIHGWIEAQGRLNGSATATCPCCRKEL